MTKKYCSYKLFSDPDIIEFIKSNGEKGKCSYTNADGIVIEFREISEYIISCILKKYEDAAHNVQYVNSEGGYQLPTMTIYEILTDYEYIVELETEAEEQLFDDITSELDDGTPYVRKYPYGPESGGENGIDAWKYFSNLIKNRQRYTSFYGIENSTFLDYDPLKSFLLDLSTIFKNDNVIKSLDSGSEIFRARIDNSKSISSFSDLSSPPPKKSNHNRFSPVGISFFYGTFETKTCIAELRPSIAEIITVGKFETTKDILLVDLINGLGEPNSIFSKDYEFHIDEFHKPFMDLFVNEISKPIRSTDSTFDYIPTQAFIECLRFVLELEIDGIIFKSSTLKGGQNIVLFKGEDILDDAEDRWLKPIEIEKFQISDIKYNEIKIEK